MCHTRNFSRVHVAQVLEPSSGQDRWIVVLASLESHSISSMFHLTLLDPTVVSAPLHAISCTCTWPRLPLLRCFIHRGVHPLPLCMERHALADWLNNHLSQEHMLKRHWFVGISLARFHQLPRDADRKCADITRQAVEHERNRNAEVAVQGENGKADEQLSGEESM